MAQAWSFDAASAQDFLWIQKETLARTCDYIISAWLSPGGRRSVEKETMCYKVTGIQWETSLLPALTMRDTTTSRKYFFRYSIIFKEYPWNNVVDWIILTSRSHSCVLFCTYDGKEHLYYPFWKEKKEGLLKRGLFVIVKFNLTCFRARFCRRTTMRTAYLYDLTNATIP